LNQSSDKLSIRNRRAGAPLWHWKLKELCGFVGELREGKFKEVGDLEQFKESGDLNQTSEKISTRNRRAGII